MHSFEELSIQFQQYFSTHRFPDKPASLYEPANYFLQLGGKRIRPVLCLMGNELFEPIHADAWLLGTAIELFHNFTLIHDDMMDKAPLRRGSTTLHVRNGSDTALLAGDVMMVQAYDYINKIEPKCLQKILHLFNKTAREVCEGQQLDMDFEKSNEVSLEAYLQMVQLKTSVLLAASLQMGAIVGGASEGNQQHLYAFGKNLGIAFQIQDDYLDAFGNPATFGKQIGGDIIANKKTFLLIYTLQTANDTQKKELESLLQQNNADKVSKVLSVFKNCGVDKWALSLKEKYVQAAFHHLEEIAVLKVRKEKLKELAMFLVQREW
jgi:geranylgeranyl diphosphate synthase, type II